MSPIEKLFRQNEVNGAKPRKMLACEKCVYGSGKHVCGREGKVVEPPARHAGV